MPMARPAALRRLRARAARAVSRTTASSREVYVTAPGSEIAEEHPLVAAIDAAHSEVFGEPPERDVVRWFSDASALTRYGIATCQLRHLERAARTPMLGENLEIDGLVKMAESTRGSSCVSAEEGKR